MSKVWYIIYISAIVLFFVTLIIGAVSKKRIIALFKRFSSLTTMCHISVREFAVILLANLGLTHIDVAEINGNDTNCYKSKFKALKFSKSIIDSESIGALGVCAHNVGDAIQDNEKVFFYKLREKLIPIMNILLKAFIPLLMIGSLLCFSFNLRSIGIYVLWISLIGYIVAFLFYFITLPVLFNSSKKVSKILFKLDFFADEEAMAIKQSFSLSKWVFLSDIAINMLWFINLMSFSRIFDKD